MRSSSRRLGVHAEHAVNLSGLDAAATTTTAIAYWLGNTTPQRREEAFYVADDARHVDGRG